MSLNDQIIQPAQVIGQGSGGGGGGYSPPIPQSDVTGLPAALAAGGPLGSFANPHPCGAATGFPVGVLSPATALPGTIPYGYCISATLTGTGGVITSLSFDAGATSSGIFKRNSDVDINYGYTTPEGGETAFDGPIILRWASVLGNDAWEIYDFHGITRNDLPAIVADLGTSTGTANALDVTQYEHPGGTFSTRILYLIRANLTNSGAVTVAKNSGTPVALRKSPSSAALVAGDIVSGSVIGFIFDGTYLQAVSGLAVSATDIPDHSADKLTSGTVPAARLPGVLANVDTQGELLSAAGAAASSHAHAAGDITSGTIATARLGSGTADGTTFLAGDQTYKAPSATDATKLPLAGGTVSGDILNSSAIRIGPNTSDVSDSGSIVFGHSGPTRGAGVFCYGNEHANVGVLRLQGGTASSACKVQFMDSGGGVGMYWDGFGGGFFSGGNGWYAQNILTVTATLTANGTLVLGSTTALASTSNGAWTETNATCIQAGQGCLTKISKLVSRSNSTAYSLCPCPAGDVLRCLLQDSSSKRALALVDASGTVTFESGSHADYVASSSPASGEVGVYVTASVLTIKPGSAGTRSIAASIERARA